MYAQLSLSAGQFSTIDDAQQNAKKVFPTDDEKEAQRSCDLPNSGEDSEVSLLEE